MTNLNWIPLHVVHLHIPAVSGVYVIRQISSGMEYVGISRDVRRRAMRHRSGRTKSSLLHRKIATYGVPDFEVALLLESPEAELPQLEIVTIAKRDSLAPKGFNLTSGGGVIHHARLSEERRALAAACARLHHKGKLISAETRARMSAAQKGRKLPAEQIARMAEARRGHKMPETTRQAILASWTKPVLVWPPGALVPLEFPTIKAAVAYTGLPQATFHRALTGSRPNRHGYALAYAE